MKKIILLLLIPLMGFGQLPYLTPEYFGALGKNKTLGQMGWSQDKINRKYPGVGATPEWTVDRAAWQMALNKGSETRRPVAPAGSKYYFNGGLTYVNDKIDFQANMVEWVATNSNVWTFLSRKVKPTSQAEAEIMLSNTDISIEGIVIRGMGKAQTGFDMNSVKFLHLQRNDMFDVATGIKTDFCMYELIEQNNCTTCKTAIRSGLGVAGNNEMSSNLSRVILNHCHTCSDTAFINLFAYESYWDQNTIEGNGSPIIGFYLDMSGKNTAKDFTSERWHLEQTGTAQVAWFKFKLRDQMVRLNVAVVHDATNGLLVDIESSNDGGIILSGLNWFDEAKYFRTRGTTWKFHFCKAVGVANKNTMWDVPAGQIAPKEGRAVDVGVHSYEIQLGW